MSAAHFSFAFIFGIAVRCVPLIDTCPPRAIRVLLLPVLVRGGRCCSTTLGVMRRAADRALDALPTVELLELISIPGIHNGIARISDSLDSS
jgi:hypothetical protein